MYMNADVGTGSVRAVLRLLCGNDLAELTCPLRPVSAVLYVGVLIRALLLYLVYMAIYMTIHT